MMRSIWLLSFVMLLGCPASAQKLYAHLGVSYSFPIAFGQQLGVNGFPYLPYTKDPVRTVLAHKGTMSKGFFASLAIGTLLTPDIGLEMEVRELLSHNGNYSNWEGFSINQYAEKLTLLSCSITAGSAQDGNGIYFKAGPLFALRKKIYIETVSKKPSYAECYTRSELFTKPAIGFTLGAYGYHRIAGHLSVFSKISLEYLACYTRQLNVLAAVANGIDIYEKIPMGQKELHFERGDHYYDGGTAAASLAKAYRIPFSSFSLELGVQYNF